MGCVCGLEAELVLATVCGAEGESASRRAALIYYAVVVVECLYDSDSHRERGIHLELPGLGIELLCFIMT